MLPPAQALAADTTLVGDFPLPSFYVFAASKRAVGMLYMLVASLTYKRVRVQGQESSSPLSTAS